MIKSASTTCLGDCRIGYDSTFLFTINADSAFHTKQLYSLRQSGLTTMDYSIEDPYSWDDMLQSSDSISLLPINAGINQEMSLCDAPESNWEALNIFDPLLMCSTDNAPGTLSTQRVRVSQGDRKSVV